MALPLLLAGPILRRVEPTLAAVWVALRESADVELALWDGRTPAREPADFGSGAFVRSPEPGTRTLRIGDKLHLALAVLEIDATSADRLQPGRTYAYDLRIRTATETHTLKSLGLLRDGDANGKPVLALGFDEHMLPSFALPPDDITQLRVVFGSCRRVVNDHLDAMTWIDDLMRAGQRYAHTDPRNRPHQLFLGGDQIYADDVSPVHLRWLLDLAQELLGRNADGEIVERLMVDSVRRRSGPAATRLDDYGEPLQRDSQGVDPAEFLLPADPAHFPAGRRFLLTTVEAQMTTVDGIAHLFAFGEFAAMYLSVWSNACWPAAPPADADITTPLWPARLPTFVDAPLNARETRGGDDPASPFRHYGALRPPEPDSRSEAEKAAELAAHLAAYHARLAAHRELMLTFERGLAKVRRTLANVPTYMIFDDHDVTDDWNLNPMWIDRVMNTSLGVSMARNALVSYALFQDWGNDPRKWKRPEYRAFLDNAARMFPAGAVQGPDSAVADALDAALGFGLVGQEGLDGSVGPVDPPIKWHFSVPGPKHLAVALDNRTRRSFVSRNGPPGNVAGSLDPLAPTPLAEAIPPGPFGDGKEVLLVIAPLQVFGPPILDEFVAPAAYRAFDAKDFADKLDPALASGARGMAGTNPDAIEAWAFDLKTFEALLRRLEPYRRVVLLSGDVHYSASNVMSYWKRGTPEPARLVQFTSSGFKNVMPSYITTVDRSLSNAHKIIRAEVGAERIVWLTRPDNPVTLPPGKSERDVPRALRAKLRSAPVMIPTHGWPRGSTINPATPPDWSWRVEPIYDLRADADRPPAIRPVEVDRAAIEAQLGEPNAPRAIEAYQALAARHQASLERLRNGRQMLFRANFGVVRFERRDGVLHAVHEMITAKKPPGEIGSDPPRPEVFVLHTAALEAPAALRPEDRMAPV